MRQKLAGKGFPEDVVDGVLSYLEEKAFIDDRKLAELLKRDAIERRHFGAQGVRNYLIKRGIAKDIADEMSEADNDYHVTAMRLAERKMRSMRHLDNGVIKRRCGGCLRGVVSLLMRYGRLYKKLRIMNYELRMNENNIFSAIPNS